MTVSKLTKIIMLTSWIPIYLIYYNNFKIGYSHASKTFIQKNHEDIKKNYSTYKALGPPTGVTVRLADVFQQGAPFAGEGAEGSRMNGALHYLQMGRWFSGPHKGPYTTSGTEKYLINTRGCYIPNYGKSMKFKESKFLNQTCGERAVFVKKIDHNKIELNIDKAKMNIYSHGKTYHCCVSFAAPMNVSGKIHLKKLEYSSCTTFQNGSKIQLEQEIVTISCYAKSTSIYEDAYIILKKLIASEYQRKSKMDSWNILVLGVDTMSRARLLSSMPKTAQYLREHNWLDFRGYQKVGYNTFPNLMSLLTGKNVSAMYKACSKGLDKCGKYLLWNKFKEDSYTTAYGEEFITLPDTFSKYDGFQKSPTDHYMRPFFLTGETVIGNYVCTKKMTSANHVLDYAYQFADTYKKQKFYGLFWINSCTHNERNSPLLFDKDFLAFFEKMHNSGVMDNTFVILISDHGIRFGSMRVPMESYYEERLPMCEMWVPKKFKELHPDKYRNLQFNQERLVTPYDLYLTMAGILQISQGSNAVTTSEACPLCHSLFEEVSPHRTCRDAGVDDKWCSCHNMFAVDNNKPDVIRSLQVITEQLNKRATNTITNNCTECYKFKMKTVLRTHTYEDIGQNKTFYVIAFHVDPGGIGYEAVVEKHSDQFSLVPFMDAITSYNSKGYCVVNPNDRGFCICKEICKGKLVKRKKRFKKNKKG